MKNFLFVACLFCWIFFARAFGMIEEPMVTAPEGFQKVVLPFSYNSDGEMVVQAEIHGLPLNLIVDTGMDAPFVLSADFCRKAGIFPMKAGNAMQSYHATLHFFGETQDRVAPVLESFDLSLNGTDFHIENGIELSDLSFFTSKPADYQGVVGWGFFRYFHLVLDYPNQQIVLENPGHFSSSKLEGVPFSNDPIPIVWVHLLGKEVPFLLDTGSPESWLSYEFLGKQVNIPEFSSSPYRFKGVVKVASLQVDHVSMPNVLLYVVENFSAKSQSQDFQGILGLNALKATTVELDPIQKTAEIRRK
jgi:hypothetical protein